MSKVAIITGATSGIGAEFARQLAHTHTELWLVGRRETELKQLASHLEQAGTHVRIWVIDLADPDQAHQFATQVAQCDHLHTLVNNAGYAVDGQFHQLPWQQHADLQQVHVNNTLKFCHVALGVMDRRGHGNIINVSSVAAFMPTPASPLYGATKTYIKALSETLALAYRERGIRIQALCPGFTRTDFHSRMGINTDRFYKDRGLLRTLTTTEVVSQSLLDLERGRLVSIPGWNYRLVVSLLRRLPFSWIHHLASRGQRSQRYQSSTD